jgi:hypothetical protein
VFCAGLLCVESAGAGEDCAGAALDGSLWGEVVVELWAAAVSPKADASAIERNPVLIFMSLLF